MAMVFSPSESRERGWERLDGRWASAVWRGVHDSINDLTNGASAGVRSPNGSQVHRLSDGATLALINFQTVAN